MTVPKYLSMNVKEKSINITKVGSEDYICLTDMVKGEEGSDHVRNWMRNRNTVEFLGLWETLNNPSFNSVEFDTFKRQSGLNNFNLTPKKWVEATGATGIISKSGRYGGTYAHKDLAFEFGAWLSPEFKLLIITEFQRLKAKEQDIVEWDSHRYLSRINYHLHTDSIKNDLLPQLHLTKLKQILVYTNEADMLNKIIFGQTASEWRKSNPELVKGGKNQRDYATIQQLVLLANLENLNAHFISEGKKQPQRIQSLLDAAERQYKSLVTQQEEQKKLDNRCPA